MLASTTNDVKKDDHLAPVLHLIFAERHLVVGETYALRRETEFGPHMLPAHPLSHSM